MTIKLYHPNASGCSVDGVAYAKGQGGAFEVQDEHAAELLHHGFTTTAPSAAPSADPEPSKRQRRKGQE